MHTMCIISHTRLMELLFSSVSAAFEKQTNKNQSSSAKVKMLFSPSTIIVNSNFYKIAFNKPTCPFRNDANWIDDWEIIPFSASNFRGIRYNNWLIKCNKVWNGYWSWMQIMIRKQTAVRLKQKLSYFVKIWS